MIGFCPLETYEEEVPLRPSAPPRPQGPRGPDGDTTECNYVVMFFIVGVIALAAMDVVKK